MPLSASWHRARRGACLVSEVGGCPGAPVALIGCSGAPLGRTRSAHPLYLPILGAEPPPDVVRRPRLRRGRPAWATLGVEPPRRVAPRPRSTSRERRGEAEARWGRRKRDGWQRRKRDGARRGCDRGQAGARGRRGRAGRGGGSGRGEACDLGNEGKGCARCGLARGCGLKPGSRLRECGAIAASGRLDPCRRSEGSRGS